MVCFCIVLIMKEVFMYCVNEIMLCDVVCVVLIDMICYVVELM